MRRNGFAVADAVLCSGGVYGVGGPYGSTALVYTGGPPTPYGPGAVVPNGRFDGSPLT